MNKLAEYKKMVMALVVGGIEIKPALDAAELVVFGAKEEAIKDSVDLNDPRNPINWPKVPALNKYDYIEQRAIAESMGISTKQFNLLLDKAGYLELRFVDKDKTIRGKSSDNYLSTYVLTEKGKRLGMGYGHANYTDGSVAVYRFKWKRSIITELGKLD